MGDDETKLPRATEVLRDVEKLWRDSHVGKDKHFSAAERKSRYHTAFGFPVVLISVFLGSAFFTELAKEDIFDSIIGPLVAFIAALFCAIQTFFNFHKATEGHRSVANRYLYISREGKALVSGAKDGLISQQHLWQRFNDLLQAYHQANTDAEAFPTSRRDYAEAKMKLEVEIGSKKVPEHQPPLVALQTDALKNG